MTIGAGTTHDFSIGEGQTPEIGSVEFSRGWTVDELSELVREGRNLCAQTSMGRVT